MPILLDTTDTYPHFTYVDKGVMQTLSGAALSDVIFSFEVGPATGAFSTIDLQFKDPVLNNGVWVMTYLAQVDGSGMKDVCNDEQKIPTPVTLHSGAVAAGLSASNA